MLPIRDIRVSIGELLAADVAFLAAVAANKVALIVAPFAQSEILVFADLTFATFTDSAPKAGVAGTQQSGIRPGVGDQVITILAPAGGWRFECTVAPGVAETVFGFALLDNAGAVLLGTSILPSTVTIAAIGDFIDLGAVEMVINAAPIS